MKLSPGKIQRDRREIRAGGQAGDPHDDPQPGTITARRAAGLRDRDAVESFVLKVADVTTGSHVVKGQPLMEVYSPAVSSAAAEYIATITSRTTGSDASLRPRIAPRTDEPRRAGGGDRRPSRTAGTFRPRSNGRRRATVSCWSASAVEGMRVQPGRRAVQDRRSFGDLGADRRRGTRSGRDRHRPARRRCGPQLSRARVLPGRSAWSIPRSTRRRAPRGFASNCQIRTSCCFTTCMSTPKSTPAAASRCWPFRKARCMDSGSRQAVLVDKGGAASSRATSKLGHRGDGYVEVRDGVAEGEPVVVSANFLIDAESNLKAALKGFSEAEPSHDRAPHRLVGPQPAAGAVRHRLRRRGRSLSRWPICRSTPFPTSPTRRSSSTRSIRARRRR